MTRAFDGYMCFCTLCYKRYPLGESHCCGAAPAVPWTNNVFANPGKFYMSPFLRTPMLKGNQYVVVCGPVFPEEFKELTDAQARAEELAHANSADAYILQPIRRISPKREVVTTNLTALAP